MTERTANCLAKLDRMNKALRHEEPDRVPVSDFFWGSFLERWREELGLPADTDIYTYYDLDWIVTMPNMDPHIKPFEILRENDEEVVVRTGFEAVIRKKFADPMPEFIGFDTDTIEKVDAFEFDDPWDDRRYLQRRRQPDRRRGRWLCPRPAALDRDGQGAAPRLSRSMAASARPTSTMTRIIGPENFLLWIGLYPERMGALCRAHQRVGAGAAQGPDQGRRRPASTAWSSGATWPTARTCSSRPTTGASTTSPVSRPWSTSATSTACRSSITAAATSSASLRTISRSASTPTIRWRPRPGMDVVDLRREYGHQIAFCGNMDVLDWAHKDEEELKAIVLRKLNAAKGGGYDLPVGPLGAQQRLGPELRVCGQPGARVWPVSAGTGRV